MSKQSTMQYATYPGLAGHDLTPKGVVELPASMKGKTGMHLFTEAQRTDRGPGGGGGGGKKGGQNRGPGEGGGPARERPQ